MLTAGREAETRIKLAKAAELELRVRERRRLLVPRRQMERDAYAEGKRLREAILAVPARIIPLICPQDGAAEGHRLLMEELRRALEGVAEGEPPKGGTP